MKKMVITGANSGIGNALVREFAKGGALVFAGCRTQEAADVLADEMKQNEISANVTPFCVDMNSQASVLQACERIKSKTDRADTLINVAGCVVAGVVEHIAIERIRAQFEVNTFSQLYFSQNLLPIIPDGGKIINISSEASFGITPFIAPYCASKRALDILFNLMQLETRRNVKIVSIKPGAVSTPIWQKAVKMNLQNGIPKGYEREMEFLVANAKKSCDKGISPARVVKLVKKVNSLKNPKPSYTIGFDAKVLEALSKLPQGWTNTIVKMALKHKLAR